MPVTGANSQTTLSGLFKIVYADKVMDLRPDNVKFCKEVPFVKQNKRNGSTYNQMITVKSEHGKQ